MRYHEINMADDQKQSPKALQAYQEFQREKRGIVQNFRQKATELIRKIDEKKTEEIKKQIEQS